MSTSAELRKREPDLFVRSAGRSRSWRSAIAPSWGQLVLVAVFALKLRGETLVAVLVLDVLLVSATVGFIWLGMTRPEFAVVGDRLWYQGRFAKRELFLDTKPARVVEIRLRWMGKGTQSFPFWAIVNTDGRVEIAVSAKLFDPDDLEKLRHRFGLEREVVPEPLRGSEAPEIYPGLVPWWMAHGVGLGAAAFVLAVIVVTAISSG